jgi:hypothetical protein
LLKKERKISEYGLHFLDELAATKERDKAVYRENEARLIEGSPPVITDIIDLIAILGLNNQEPDFSFLANMDFIDGIPQAS